MIDEKKLISDLTHYHTNINNLYDRGIQKGIDIAIEIVNQQFEVNEDMREAGRFVEIPCAIGTHLWRVTKLYRQEPKVTEYVVKNFRTTGKKHRLQLEVQALSVPLTNWMSYSDFFVTREEAEKALADMQGK